jgi:hypothetical protein
MNRIVLIMSFLVSLTAFSQQIISTNTTWSGNVFLSQKVIVNEGVTLTIEAGTNVQIAYVDANGDKIGDVEIVVNGLLKSNGVIECNPIVIAPYTSSMDKNYWTGITINSKNKNDSIYGIKISNANIPFNIKSDVSLTSIKIDKFGNIGVNYEPLINSSILNLNSILIKNGGTGIISKNSTSRLNANWIEIDSCQNSIINYESTFNLNYCKILNSNRIGISNMDGKMNLSNSILRKNYAFGIINSSGDMDMTHCIVDSNSLGGILIAGLGLNKVDYSSIKYNKGSQIEITDYKIEIVAKGSMYSPSEGKPTIKINNNNILGDTSSKFLDTAALFYLGDVQKNLQQGYSENSYFNRNSNITLQSVIGRAHSVFISSHMINKCNNSGIDFQIKDNCSSISYHEWSGFSTTIDKSINDWIGLDNAIINCFDRDKAINFSFNSYLNTNGINCISYYLSLEKLRAKYYLGGKLIFNSISDNTGYKFDFKNNNFNQPILTKMFQDDSYMIDYSGYNISSIPNSGLNELFGEFENKSLPLTSLNTNSGKDTLCENSSKLSVLKINNATYKWILNGNLFTSTSNNEYVSATNGVWQCEVSSSNCNFISTKRMINLVKNNMNISGNLTICQGDSIKLKISEVDFFKINNKQFVQSYNYKPLNSESISIYGYVNGCENKKDLKIVVNSLPLPTILPSPSITLCTGSTIDFTVSNAVSYLWSTGEKTKTIKVAKDGVYNVQVVDSNGCKNSSSYTTVIKKDPIPIDVYVNGSLINNDVVPFCLGKEIKLKADKISSISWDNGILNDVPFTPISSKTYTVSGYDLNGCYTTKSIVLNSNANTSNTPTNILFNGKLINNDSSICFGNKVILNAENLTSPVWDNQVVNNTEFSPTQTKTYSVKGNDLNGCAKELSVKIIVNPLPIVSIKNNGTNICPGDEIQLNGQGAKEYSWDNNILDGVASKLFQTTKFKVIGTDVNGCSNISELTVNVKPVFQIKANSNKNNSCSGEAITLFGSGGKNYSWNNNVINSVPFIPTESKMYIVKSLNDNGCNSIDSIYISIGNKPNVYIVAQDTKICQGYDTRLDAYGAVNYVWDNDIVNHMLFTPISTKKYTVIGTDENGCKDTADITIIVIPKPNVVISQFPQNLCEGATNVKLTATGAISYTWYLTGNSNFKIENGVQFKPIEGKYQLWVVDTNNCMTDRYYDLVFHKNPTISIQKSTSSVLCSGDLLSLTALGASKYTWDNNVANGISFNVTDSKKYTVTGVNDKGCSTLASVDITVKPLPTKPIISLSSTNLVSSASNGYQWYLNNQLLANETNQSLVVSKNGLYTVVVNDTYGCKKTSDAFEYKSLSLDDLKASSLLIYPNPTSDLLTITNASLNHLEVVDITGKVLYTNFITSDKFQISMKGFAVEGVYFVNILDGNHSILETRKIVLDK